jgi:hypothetical protein
VIVIGVDPGNKGYLAVLEPGQEPKFIPVPTKVWLKGDGSSSNVIDSARFARILIRHVLKGPVHVVIEWIWGFGAAKRGKRGNKTKGEFSFAEGYGELVGTLNTLQVIFREKFSFTLISPMKWAKAVGKRAKKEDEDGKEASIERAYELYPTAELIGKGCRVPNDNRAEALLMAYFGTQFVPEVKNMLSWLVPQGG